MGGPMIDEQAFDRLVASIDGTPWMTPSQGRTIWTHFASCRPRAVLDVGTCFGTSAAYFAGAMQALGIDGTVVTVDSAQFDATTDILARLDELWDRCGVGSMIRPERIEHSSYAWWLLEEVERARDRRGRIVPSYDFVYLDGAKLFTLDTTAVVLIERLLRPGGWVLLDDLDWAHTDHDEHSLPVLSYGDGARYPLSAAERSRPQLLALWNAVVETDPQFDRTRIDDAQWGWARKRAHPARPPVGRVLHRARRRAVEALDGTTVMDVLRTARDRMTSAQR